MNHVLVPKETLQQVFDAAEKFRLKVHRGQAKSVETYADMTAIQEAMQALLDAPCEPKQMTPIQVRDRIADWIDININHREFWTPDVVELIRSIEINGQGYAPKEPK